MKGQESFNPVCWMRSFRLESPSTLFCSFPSSFPGKTCLSPQSSIGEQAMGPPCSQALQVPILFSQGAFLLLACSCTILSRTSLSGKRKAQRDKLAWKASSCFSDITSLETERNQSSAKNRACQERKRQPIMPINHPATP